MGLRPMRCSSVAQSSTWAWGKAVATAWTSGLSFFEGGLLLGVGQHMAGARFAALAVQAHQVGPAQIDTDRPAELLAHPGRHRPAQPVLPLRCRSADRLRELRQLLP